MVGYFLKKQKTISLDVKENERSKQVDVKLLDVFANRLQELQVKIVAGFAVKVPYSLASLSIQKFEDICTHLKSHLP